MYSISVLKWEEYINNNPWGYDVKEVTKLAKEFPDGTLAVLENNSIWKINLVYNGGWPVTKLGVSYFHSTVECYVNPYTVKKILGDRGINIHTGDTFSMVIPFGDWMENILCKINQETVSAIDKAVIAEQWKNTKCEVKLINWKTYITDYSTNPFNIPTDMIPKIAAAFPTGTMIVYSEDLGFNVDIALIKQCGYWPGGYQRGMSVYPVKYDCKLDIILLKKFLDDCGFEISGSITEDVFVDKYWLSILNNYYGLKKKNTDWKLLPAGVTTSVNMKYIRLHAESCVGSFIVYVDGIGRVYESRHIKWIAAAQKSSIVNMALYKTGGAIKIYSTKDLFYQEDTVGSYYHMIESLARFEKPAVDTWFYYICENALKDTTSQMVIELQSGSKLWKVNIADDNNYKAVDGQQGILELN